MVEGSIERKGAGAARELARAATDRARADLSNAIEAVQEGFALFDAEDRLVMFNARFGLGMPDIRRALRPGLSFSDYVDAISRSPHLSLPSGQSPAAPKRGRSEPLSL